MPVTYPTIPFNITVHLGRPEADAQNVTVSFIDYIKNVASSEVYPTWPESALIANIYAQISFALNRVFTEYYRSRGYPFDITNSTAFDQSFQYGRNIFSNIDRLVDQIFDNYIRRINFLEPLSARYCNGTTVTCEGLSQWGSASLAEQGYIPYEILTYYYGDDIELVRDVPLVQPEESYPGSPVELGDQGAPVIRVQRMLNQISQNYPAIPKIYPVDGIFGEQTRNAVITFQRIFNLTPDGIVGRATWYRMVYLFVGILQLSELESEGVQLFGRSLAYPDAVEEGNVGEKVYITQYFLGLISQYYPTVPYVPLTGRFEQDTKNSVIAFQRTVGLPETGIVDDATWNELYRAFVGIEESIATYEAPFRINVQPFPGETLKEGDRGEDVRTLQQYLNYLSAEQTGENVINVTGIYGPNTKNAVTAFQQRMGLPETGEADRATWDALTREYRQAVSSTAGAFGQHPGMDLQTGSRDLELYHTNLDSNGTPVRDLQQGLRDLSQTHSNIRPVIPDGIYDENTAEAVRDFQREVGLPETGIMDFDTWTELFRIWKEEQSIPADDCRSINPDNPRELQVALAALAERYPNLLPVELTGVYDEQTDAAVQAIAEIGKLAAEDPALFDLIDALYRSCDVRELEDRLTT